MQVKWAATNNEGKGIRPECSYTGNGKMPLITTTAAFLTLAMAMVVQHTYLLVAVSKSDALLELSCDTHSNFARAFAWQAGFFFITTWYGNYTRYLILVSSLRRDILIHYYFFRCRKNVSFLIIIRDLNDTTKIHLFFN